MERKYMIRNILLASFLFLTVISCKRDSFLDTTNKANLDDGTMWISEKNADIFLNGCYAELYPTGADWPDTQLDNFSDDAHARVYFGSYAWKEGTIDISLRPTTSWKAQGPSNGNNSWQKTYQNVRNLNSFIENVRNNAQNFSTEYILKRIDEARFLRAYFYSELFMRVGGVVIDTVVQRRSSSSTEELQSPRNTFEETYDFIIGELDEILNNGYLEVKYEASDADAGRATLGSALVLKGWLQLFAASPAYNSSLPAISSDPGNLQHFSSADPGRWAIAAATNKKFIETWGHKGEGIYQLFADMVNFWREENEYNSEVIWDRQFVPVTMPNWYGAYGGPCNIDDIINVDWGEYQPTQSIIDDYQMANGKDITDPASGYNPQDPYVGREKRFYDFICYDGAPYYREWMSKTDTVWMRIDKVNPRNNEIDLSGANDATQTGYWFTKQLSKYDPRNLVDCGQNYVFYRYAEVLLNYAEAQNEAVGPDASVYEAINAIRTRPGTDLPELQGGLSKEEMRQAIHRERRIELAYEQKRLFDIWRWKEADARLNQPTMGMKVYNSKPNDNSGVWIYEKFPLAMGYLFTNKMYFCPIPQEVIDRNPKIVQNSGY